MAVFPPPTKFKGDKKIVDPVVPTADFNFSNICHGLVDYIANIASLKVEIYILGQTEPITRYHAVGYSLDELPSKKTEVKYSFSKIVRGHRTPCTLCDGWIRLSQISVNAYSAVFSEPL